MAQIPPITDAYIDEIVKAPDAYNPTLNKTQGVKLRELLKLMRDRLEQQAGGITAGSDLISVTYQELTSLMFLGALIPGKRYLLTDYKTTWRISDNSIRRADDVEPLILLALTTFKISTEAYSTIYPQDKIYYLVGALDYDGNATPYIAEDWSSLNGLIPETGFIYRRIDSLANLDINFDFRGFWYDIEGIHIRLYFLNNVKITSGALDSEYIRKPIVLGYRNVYNSTINVGISSLGSETILAQIPETQNDLKLTISNSFVDIMGVSSDFTSISIQNSNIKSINLKSNMPSLMNIDNFLIYGYDISVYGNSAFELLASDKVKVSVTISNDYILQIAWVGENASTGFRGVNLYDFAPIYR